MLRMLRAGLVALFTAAAATLAPAHETDQFTIPDKREYADLGDYVNRWMYGAIERAVDKTNARIREAVDQRRSERDLAELQSPDEIVRAVNGELPWAMDVIEGFEALTENPAMQRRYPGRLLGYKRMIGNIYQHVHFPLDPRQFFRLFLGSTLNVYGTWLGTDKIGHFTDMGMNYYRSYRAALREGKSDDAAVNHAVYLGTHGLIFSERGMLGFLSAGSYSNGDLAANYLGFLFYRNLTDTVMLKGSPHPPMLVHEGPYWKIAPHVRRDSRFFAAFISDHMDEALNPNLYEEGMRKAIREAVQKRAPLVLWRYRDPHGNIRPAEYFQRKQEELSTYWGFDYGHLGHPSELITLANAAIPALPALPADAPTSAAPAYPDARGRTALHWAARGESDATAAAKPADLNAPDHHGLTPLHAAARHDNPAVASALLREGARIDARDPTGATPLHLAAARRDPAVARILLDQRASVSARDDFGCTPLHDAARAGAEETVERLLAAGAAVQAADDYATTPLHLAARNSRILIVRILLDRGADPRAANAAGSTPLHEAALAGDKAILRELLQRGADPSVRNRQGRTPVQVAEDRGYGDVAEFIRANSGKADAK